jgi:hypothetical protein
VYPLSKWQQFNTTYLLMAAWPRSLQWHCARFFEQNMSLTFCSMAQAPPNRSKVPYAGAVDKSEEREMVNDER